MNLSGVYKRQLLQLSRISVLVWFCKPCLNHNSFYFRRGHGAQGQNGDDESHGSTSVHRPSNMPRNRDKEDAGQAMALHVYAEVDKPNKKPRAETGGAVSFTLDYEALTCKKMWVTLISLENTLRYNHAIVGPVPDIKHSKRCRSVRFCTVFPEIMLGQQIILNDYDY